MSTESPCDLFSVRIRSGLSDNCPFTVEPVANPPPADQIARCCRLVLDLLAQRHDVVINHAIGDGDPLTPDLVEKAFAREQAPAVVRTYRELATFRER